MVTVVPCGGLANRMRVVHSALEWQKRIGEPIRVGWIENAELNCAYDKLWKKSSLLLVRSFPKRYTKLLRLKRVTGLRGLFKLLEDHHLLRIWATEEYEELIHYAQAGKRNRHDIVFSYSEFMPAENFSKELFCLTDELEKRLNELTATFPTHIIGLHIRRTDNSWAIENSPLGLFEEKIEAEIRKDREVHFFLATDDEKTKQELQQRYAGRIHTLESELRRDSENGITDAVIEMYALSRTRKIYGSYYSSFSEMAARIGDVELEVVRI